MSKIALVTGANGGIGDAISRGLIEAGFKIVASYFPGDEESAQKWFSDNSFTDQQVRLLPLDVTDREACAQAMADVLEKEGQVDVLVNNAGITRDGQFKKMDGGQWDAVISTNLTSLYNITQPLFESMLNRKQGRIINITSVNGIKGQFGQVNYSAAKAGVIGFTKALAAEGARAGVTVNAIAPGYTGTPMVTAIREDILEGIVNQVPMKRLATPEEIGGAVVYLASDLGGYITGETLSINGGLHMH